MVEKRFINCPLVLSPILFVYLNRLNSTYEHLISNNYVRKEHLYGLYYKHIMIFIQMSYMLTNKIWSKRIASGLISLMNSLIHMMQITSVYSKKVKAVEGNINLNTLSRFE